MIDIAAIAVQGMGERVLSTDSFKLLDDDRSIRRDATRDGGRRRCS